MSKSNFDDLFGGEPSSSIESKPESIKEEKPKKERKPREKREPKVITQAVITPELHILTEENVLIFIKQVNRTKKYELKHRFYNSSSLEISNIIDNMLKEGKLQRYDYGWIGVKE